MFNFGAGIVVCTPKTDYTGTAIAVPSPVQIATLQDISVDTSFEVKELYGAYQFPVDAGRGKGKIDIKAKAASVCGPFLNSFLTGQGTTAGYEAIYAPTTGFAIGTAGQSYQVQITPTVNGVTGNFADDLGVRDGNFVPYTRLSTVPTGAQRGTYYVTGPSGVLGLYYFAADDFTAGVTPFIAATMTNSGTPTGSKIQTVTNPIMGYSPTFQLDLMEQKNGKTLWVRFFNVQSMKLSAPYKNDDYMIMDLDMVAYADPSTGNVFKWDTSE